MIRNMHTFTTNGKTVSLFPSLEAGAPLSTSTPSSPRARRYTRPHRLPATRCSHWWLPAIWTGTTTCPPGIVTRIQKCGARTTIFASWPEKSSQRQRKRSTEPLVGEASPGTRWPDRMYFYLRDKESKTRNPVLRSVRRTQRRFKRFIRIRVSTRYSSWTQATTLSRVQNTPLPVSPGCWTGKPCRAECLPLHSISFEKRI